MIVTVHHMPLAWDFTMTDPHREDWLRWQGQTPGKHHLLRWDSVGTQLGGEDWVGQHPRADSWSRQEWMPTCMLGRAGDIAVLRIWLRRKPRKRMSPRVQL